MTVFTSAMSGSFSRPLGHRRDEGLLRPILSAEKKDRLPKSDSNPNEKYLHKESDANLISGVRLSNLDRARHMKHTIGI